MPASHVHITGASGSGTSTLGRAVASRLGCPVLDADDFYWLPTQPPYAAKRDREQRWAVLRAALEEAGACWVLSGSVVGWSPDLEAMFTLIVLLEASTLVRLERLRRREDEEHGSVDQAFLDWAAEYDTADESMRSRRRHESWLSGQACPVLRLDSTRPVEALTDAVLEAVHR